MSSRDLTLSMRLYADTARFVAGMVNGERGVKKFAGGVKREFEALKGVLGSVEGKLASLGVSVGAVASIAQSARMDKSLTQIGQTAGVSKSEVESLRKELFRMGGETGQSIDDLQQGFNNAVQAGLSFKEAMPVIDSVNKAVAVTGANADSLTSALSVTSAAFGFDLAKPNQALELLDKMTVAGRLGNAELEQLSSIFSRIGVNAGAAGFGFDATLAFVEGLSQIERQPERLATLADSTLRLFNNMNYMKSASKATGVSFYDTKGMKRDPVSVLEDVKKKYDKLKTDKQKDSFISAAFGQTDLDTIKGLRKMLSGSSIEQLREQAAKIKNAGGTLERDLVDAIHNSIDQTGRLKARLREAADGFAKPINETFTNITNFALDKKENGGLDLSGENMVLGGMGLVLGTLAAARYGGKALSKRFGGTAAGVAEGKALEAAAGVTPVFVVNMPGGGMMPGGMDVPGGIGKQVLEKGMSAANKFKVGAALLGGSNLSALRLMGAGAMGVAGLGVTAAGATGYGVGTGIYKYGLQGNAGGDAIGEGIAKLLAFYFGNKEAEAALYANGETTLNGELRIKFDRDNNPSVTGFKADQPGMRVNVHNGLYMAGAN
jgi:TP901 family phage tail tape measure protein